MSREDSVRSIHISNLSSRVEQGDLEDAFKEFCDSPRVEMKQGYAFALLSSAAAAEKAMSARIEVKGSTLRLQYARRDTEVKQREQERAGMPPSRVLFVVNYDTQRVTERMLRSRFSRHGNVSNMTMTTNFALIEFEDLEDAKRAKADEDGTSMDGRRLTVQYSNKSDLNRRDREGRNGRDGRSDDRPVRRSSRSRSRGGSPRGDARRGKRSRSRSPTPPRRKERRSRSRSASPVRRARSPSPPRRGRSPTPPPRRRSRSPLPPPRRSRSASPARRRRSPSRERKRSVSRERKRRSPSGSPPRRRR